MSELNDNVPNANIAQNSSDLGSKVRHIARCAFFAAAGAFGVLSGLVSTVSAINYNSNMALCHKGIPLAEIMELTLDYDTKGF